ncbi:MAG: hypothetical protein ABSB88_07700 [Bryobacteraceae bacterium]|jgi:hypothetical protein
MGPLSLPAAVVIEFLTWLVWFIAFAALEKSLCLRYPGIRSLCRMLFLGTAAIAIVPGVWTLAATRFHGPLLLAAVTHAFTLGVLAQTAVRSLLLVRWLAWSGPRVALAMVASTPQLGAAGERNVLMSLLAIKQVLQLARKEPVDRA